MCVSVDSTTHLNHITQPMSRAYSTIIYKYFIVSDIGVHGRPCSKHPA